MPKTRKKPSELRSHRWFGAQDLRAFGHRSRAAQAEQPGPAVVVMQPGRVQLVMARGRAEVPEVGIAVSREQ